MRFYKRRIALFFALLFVGSQLNYAFHGLLESHGHCHKTYAQKGDANSDILLENEAFFDDVCNCLICQQHQSIKLHLAGDFNLELKEKVAVEYKDSSYTQPLISTCLLKDTPLRAPPTC